MILGQMVPYWGTTKTLYSPPFGRGGETGTFSIDVMHKVGTNITLVVGIQTKNAQDATWSPLDPFANITSTGLKSKTVSGLLEQVRFAYSFSDGASGDFYWINVLAPVFQTY